jgi:acetolactate synthase-1/2/3 large subunit
LDDVDEPWSTDFGGVDYVKIAEGFGFETARITSDADIEPILAKAISNQGANFIEIMVPTQDEIVPFVPSWVRAARAKNLPHFY